MVRQGNELNGRAQQVVFVGMPCYFAVGRYLVFVCAGLGLWRNACGGGAGKVRPVKVLAGCISGGSQEVKLTARFVEMAEVDHIIITGREQLLFPIGDIDLVNMPP